MNAAVPTTAYDLPALLEQAGALPRGNRHDCPRCGGRRTLTHTEEVFYCHRCQWRGNTVTLARELGLAWRPSPAEYRDLRQERGRADRAARALYQRLQARRFEVLDELHGLNRLELQAHEAGPDHPATWDALALCYHKRPGVLAELAVLETSRAADLARFLAADDEARRKAIDRVLCGAVWIERSISCLHCGSLRGPGYPQPGRCPGPKCWRGCSGVCLECGGKGTVALPVPLEVTV